MKKLILGIVIGLLVGTAGTALAASDLVGTKVQAVFASFNLVINGEAKEMETAPLVYNGTSYLPVKEIANLTGFDVTYIAGSRTIKLNSSEKEVSNMTATTTDEYMSVRSIAERDGLILGFNQNFKGLQKGDSKIEVDLDAISTSISNPTVIKSAFGDIRFFKDGSTAKININDWDSILLKITN